MADTERTLKGLANRRRLAILRYLDSTGKASVGDIAQAIKLSFRATSRHLRVLAIADLVDRHQVSVTMFYSLSKPHHPILQTTLTFV